jgi:hypothetical protein
MSYCVYLFQENKPYGSKKPFAFILWCARNCVGHNLFSLHTVQYEQLLDNAETDGGIHKMNGTNQTEGITKSCWRQHAHRREKILNSRLMECNAQAYWCEGIKGNQGQEGKDTKGNKARKWTQRWTRKRMTEQEGNEPKPSHPHTADNTETPAWV